MAPRSARPSGMKLSAPLADAWRTLVPAGGDPHGPLPPLLLALTVVTGLVDAVSYLVLGHVFVANMTGNVVFLGFALAGASGFSIAASLAALGAFSLGALAGGRMTTELGAHRGRLLAVAGGVEVALVVASVGLAATARDPGSGSARYVLIVLLGVAMGTQNAAARKLAVPDLTTTVLTLTITGIFADSRLAGGAGSKIGRRLLSTLAMFLGGLVGALLVLHARAALAIAVASGVLVVVAVTAAVQSRRSRSRPGSWQRPPNPPGHSEPPQPGATTDRGSEVITKVSPRSVADTVARLSTIVAARGMKQFAVIDHSGEAQHAGLELRDTKLVIFGSPQAGTPLMVAAPLVALDLPLRVLVWADGHRTQVSYTAPTTLAARYGLSQDLRDRLAGIDAVTSAAIEA